MTAPIVGRWVAATCEEREALIDRLGRSHNGFSEASGICVHAGRTDLDGQFGTPEVFTEWGYRRGDQRPILRDHLWPDSDRPCEHYIFEPPF